MVFVELLSIVFALWGVYKLSIIRLKSLCAGVRPYCRPSLYGMHVVLWTLLTLGGTALLGVALNFQSIYLTPQITLWPCALILGGALGIFKGWTALDPSVNVLKKVDGFLKKGLLVISLLSVMVTFSIVLSMFFESLRFFQEVPLVNFLFGTQWIPYTLPGQAQGSFGAIPLFTGTVLISTLAMCVAVPLGILVAVYSIYYASPLVRGLTKPVLGILAGIPTVVYGFFAVSAMSPLMAWVGHFLQLEISSENALGAGVVMGIMILPTIASLTHEVLCALPVSFKEGALGLGATLRETILTVLLPAARPGLLAVCLLGVSRAVGETMLVVMAVGLFPQVSFNPLASVTTVTVQIVSLLTGDQSFHSTASLGAFALGLVLFLVTLSLNMLALKVVRRYRERYDF